MQGLILGWSGFTGEDLGSNRLYRSEHGWIEGDTTIADLMAVFDEPSVTQWTDSGVTPNHRYYYSMLTTNALSLSTWSNGISIIRKNWLEFPNRIIADIHCGNWANTVVVSAAGDYAVQSSETVYYNEVNVITLDNLGLAYSIEPGTNISDACGIPGGNLFYLASSQEDHVFVLDPDLELITNTVQMSVIPDGICSNPNGGRAYAASSNDHVVSVIDTETHTVTDWAYTAYNVDKVVCHPSGDHVYASSEFDDNVSVIRTSDLEVVAVVDVGDRPIDMCCHPDGSSVYVLCSGGSGIHRIDCSTFEVMDVIGSSETSLGICILPGGDYFYVTENWGSQVSIFDTDEGTVVHTVNVPDGPNSTDATPDGEMVLVNCNESIAVLGY